MMTATSSADLAEELALPGGHRGLDDAAQDSRGRSRADEHVGAADHDRDEGLDDEGRAHRRHHGHGRRVEPAGQPGERGAEAEGQAVDPPRVDARALAPCAGTWIVARASTPKRVRLKSR